MKVPFDVVTPRHNQCMQFLNCDPWITYGLPHLHLPYHPWGQYLAGLQPCKYVLCSFIIALTVVCLTV